MAKSIRIAVPDPVAHAALFPVTDLPAPPAGHPDRRVRVAGVPILLSAERPDAIVFPE